MLVGCRNVMESPELSTASQPDGGQAPQARINLHIGEEALIPFVTGMKIRLDDITEDSRCPVGATCVWEGNARAAMTVTNASGTQSKFTLDTSSICGSSYTDAFGWRIALHKVVPDARQGDPIRKKEYEVQLDVLIPASR